MKSQIVFLSVNNTNVIESIDELVEVLDQLPNLLELHTDFDDVDAEEFSQLVANMYQIQRLNDFQIKEQQIKIEFYKVITPKIENVMDQEALSLLNELAENTNIKQKMHSERQKMDLQAKSLIIESSQVKKNPEIPDEVRERIRQELNPEIALKKNSMLPELYKELYQKPF